MKAWLRTWFIEKLGGYTSIESAIAAIKDENRENRNRILTLAVKKLFNTLGPDDILQPHESGTWFFQGKMMSKEDVGYLQAEAEKLMDSKLWKILQADVKYQANRKTFILSKTEEDLTAGKLWMFTFDTMNTRLKSMTKRSAAFNKK